MKSLKRHQRAELAAREAHVEGVLCELPPGREPTREELLATAKLLTCCHNTRERLVVGLVGLHGRTVRQAAREAGVGLVEVERVLSTMQARVKLAVRRHRREWAMDRALAGKGEA